MSYPKALETFGVPSNVISTIDIRKDSLALIKEDYLKCKVTTKFDLIITNPPFSHALPIIEKAFNDVKEGGYVIMLLRLNFFGSKSRFSFWKNFLPSYCFVHHKRMSFTEDGKTDSIEYMHAVWKIGRENSFTQLKVI